MHAHNQWRYSIEEIVKMTLLGNSLSGTVYEFQKRMCPLCCGSEWKEQQINSKIYCVL